MKYKVLGVLGTSVGEFNSTHECINAVLKQIPLSKKNTAKLRGRIDRSKSGTEIAQDYGTTTVYIEVR